MKINVDLFLLPILAISLLTLNMAFYDFGDYTLTGAFLFILTLIMFNRNVSFSFFNYFLITVVYLLCVAIFQFGTLDVVQFVKSYFQLIVSIFCFCYTTVNSVKLKKDSMKTLIGCCLFIIFGFELAQILEQLILGSHTLWFFFEGVSTSTATSVGRFQDANFLNYMRPISIYYEPSYLAFILLLLFSVNDLHVRSKTLSIVCIAGIILSLSTTFIFFLLVYFGISRFKNSSQLLLPILITISLFGILLLVFPEALRLRELSVEGSSGHERLIKPLWATVQYLSMYPLGLAVGQSYFLYNNSFYLVILYFGVSTPLLLVAFYYLLKLKIDNIVIRVRYIILLVSLLFLNGAIFTLEGAFLMSLINLIFFNENINKYD